MSLNWFDPVHIPFAALTLLERVQISWFPQVNFPEPETASALRANPMVVWFLGHKCPEIRGWLENELELAAHLPDASPAAVRQAEVAMMRHIVDWLVYVLDPAIYDQQDFLNWDSHELTGLVDLNRKTVIDVGAGTGRLALTAAPLARWVFAVEPVSRLRDYLREKARAQGLSNLYVVDGLITQIPYPDSYADVVLGGHVFGDDLAAEYHEVLRVTRPGGMILFLPATGDEDNDTYRYLVEHGFQWARFEEPGDGMKRKYWKLVEK